MMLARPIAAMALTLMSCNAAFAAEADTLAAVWQAHRIFGPLVGDGPVYVCAEKEGPVAEVNGRRVPGVAEGSRWIFDFGDDFGSLRWSPATEGNPRAHWVQPPLQSNGTAYASPVKFSAGRASCWRGELAPLRDDFTMFLVITRTEDGELSAFIRNPDRNLGLFLQPSRVEITGEKLTVFGRFRGRGEEQVLFTGRYDPADDRLSLFVPSLEATLDFERAGERSNFYARDAHPGPWEYHPPLATGDGWPVGTLDQAGIDIAPIRAMIQEEVARAPSDVHAHDLHGVLIARNGVLVLEEYFHGFHRDRPHDTRSASKSLTATLYGASIEAGLIGERELPVYATLGADPDSLDPRKGRMTSEHLLTQTSGLYCDDRDPDAPGNEDRMQEQTDQPDWYRYTLSVPMAYEPGERAVYCSANSNLLGNLLSAATHRSLETLFQELIAIPLGIQRYYLNLQPTGQPYMGGGIRWLPRDFMKLGQLYLDNGTWHGERILDAGWAKRATTRQVAIGERGYGYQWWVEDFPYGDRSVEVFYAGGNGGQVVAVARQLGLVVAFFGGNYSDPILFRNQNVLLPEYILKALRDGDRASTSGGDLRESDRNPRSQ